MIRADKKFGQHFLVNEGIVSRIAGTVASLAREGGKNRRVLEIGPGPGALTVALLGQGLDVVALELDERMIPVLTERFEESIRRGQLKIIQGDAMTYSLSELEAEFAQKGAVVCGNLPYNVGSQIVFRFLEEFSPADRFCYMLQKEVVLKFISGSQDDYQRRDYGPPGVKLQWCARVRGHFWVSPGSFKPPPRVDSGVFSFERLPAAEALADALERGGAYDKAGAIVEKVFRQRRKMIKAACPELAQLPVGFKRAEELRPQELFELSALIETASKSG